MTERKVNEFWGWHIKDAIAELIRRARTEPVQTEFNGVTIYANADSDADLLYRDWDRALLGYIANPVGPYPMPQLSAAELAHDAEIKRQNELRWAEQDRVRREEQAREKAEYEDAMAGLPAMERDEAEWQKGIAAQKGDGYGLMDIIAADGSLIASCNVLAEEESTLLAAAPDIKAVLIDMLAGLEYLRTTNRVPYGFGIDRLEKTGRAAIAKATGKA